MANDINLNHLVEVVSARSLHCKRIIFITYYLYLCIYSVFSGDILGDSGRLNNASLPISRSQYFRFSNVTLYGKINFAYVIKLRFWDKERLPELSELALSAIPSVLLREKCPAEDRAVWKWKQREREREIWRCLAAAGFKNGERKGPWAKEDSSREVKATNSSLHLPERVWLCWHLGFGPLVTDFEHLASKTERE